MKGKVINFNQDKSFGFILGEDGKNYFFHTSDVNLPFEVSKNKMLTFNPSSNQKGLCAKNVILGKGKQPTQKNNNFNKPLSNKRGKDKILKLRNLRIRASDIKEYKVVREQRAYVHLDHDNFGCRGDSNGNFNPQGGHNAKPRWCYTSIIETYTSGIKKLEFKDCDEKKNKKEAYNLLDYIDDELNQLI